MKHKVLLSLAFLIALVIPQTANAGFRIGPRVGMEVNKLHFNSDLFDEHNRIGYTAGLQAEVMFGPLGIDASVLYTRRTQEAYSSTESIDISKDYIRVPVNLKTNFGLPFVGRIISPYIFTGPDFAFLTSRRAITEAWENRKVAISWNVGFGVELIKHLQISASYGLGITKLSHRLNLTELPEGSKELDARNNQWTVTAAWLF
ncbi:MAG: porin family protein [Muribaculaceae bacterium]|nr:porin family protein [Muribaculaceae bacterium]